MLSCRLCRRSGTKRRKGFFFFLLFVASSAGRFGAASPNGEQLLAPAATTTEVPLSENEHGATPQSQSQSQHILQQHERWEIKYETLEAATEQFRIRAKSCQQQLEEETIRCTELERESLQLHATHNTELSTLQATLDTLQDTHSTMQHEYQTQLWNQMTQIAFFEEQVSLKDAEMAQLQQKLQSIRAENALLLTLMSTDNMNRKAGGDAVDDTQQHNATADNVINTETTKSHSRFSEGTIQFQSSVLELLEGWWTTAMILSSRWEATTLDRAKQVSTWTSNVLLPNLQDVQSHLVALFQQESTRLFQSMKEGASRISNHCYTVFDVDSMTFEQGLRQGVEISQTLLVSLIRLLASTADWISDSFQEVCKLGYEKIAPWIIQQAHHMADITRQILKNLHHFHQGVVVVFDFCIVAASNYFLTNYGGSRDHWVNKLLLFVKSNNTSLLVALLEVLVGLAIIQISLTAFLRRYRPNRERRVKTIQSRGHELSVSLSRRSNHHHTSISKSSLSCSTQQQSLVSLRSNHPNQHLYSSSNRRRNTDELSIGGWSTTGQQVVSEIQSCCSDEYY